MAHRNRSTAAWKAWFLLSFSTLVVVSCLVSLFTATAWTAEWFAAISGVGVFGPVLVLAIVLMRPRPQHSRGIPRNTALLSAVTVFAGLAVATASAAVSGYIAHEVDGVTSFATGTGSAQYDLPVPVFTVIMGVVSLGLATVAALGVRELLRQRADTQPRGSKRHH